MMYRLAVPDTRIEMLLCMLMLMHLYKYVDLDVFSGGGV